MPRSIHFDLRQPGRVAMFRQRKDQIDFGFELSFLFDPGARSVSSAVADLSVSVFRSGPVVGTGVFARFGSV